VIERIKDPAHKGPGEYSVKDTSVKAPQSSRRSYQSDGFDCPPLEVGSWFNRKATSRRRHHQ